MSVATDQMLGIVNTSNEEIQIEQDNRQALADWLTSSQTMTSMNLPAADMEPLMAKLRLIESVLSSDLEIGHRERLGLSYVIEDVLRALDPVATN